MSKSNRRDFLKKVGAVGLFYAFNKIAVDYKNVGVPVLRQSTKVQYKDPNGTVCTDTVKVWCDSCPADPVLTFDDANTSDTIVAGNNIMVYVTGGKLDLTWDVSGTGYTWHSNGLTTLVSSNRSEQLDCAAGT